MGITRRDFVKLVVGGVAGLQVTPLPWKLTDDIAIWTQNWPWVPVPPAGAFSHEKSVCTLCPGGCGIEVRKVDDRAVKIEGRTDFPINPGGICPVGMGGLQLLYDKDLRFTSPMKRVGPRGLGEFVPISWEEAIGILASKVKRLRLDGKPEQLVAIDGNRRDSTISLLISRLLRAIGSPNYIRCASVEDTYWMLNVLMQGREGPIGFDLENSDFILSFGCGLLEGWGSPGRILNTWGMWHEQNRKGKIRIVQVDSRASNTASKADQWLPVRPGTEAALALGMAYVIIKEGLFSREFVENHTFGFEDWTSSDGKRHMGFKSLVFQKYPPSQVADITGIEPGAIEKLARDFARARAPIAIFGKGKGLLNGSIYEFMAVHSLNALVGNINMPGGVLVHDPLPLKDLPAFEPDPIAEAGLAKPRVDGADSKRYPFTDGLIRNFSEAVVKSSTPLVDTLLIFGANPSHTEPDGSLFYQALKKIPFIVSFSPYRDETALMADLVLPDHTFLEKMEEILWPPALQYAFYGLSKPVVGPVFRTKNLGDTLLEVAKALEEPVASAFPWDSYEQVLKTRAEGLFASGGGMVSHDGTPPWVQMKKGTSPKPGYKSFEEMWEAIKATGMWYRPTHSFKNWEKIFKTPNYKFEFFSTQIQLAADEFAQVSDKPAQVLKEMAIEATGDEAFLPHQEPPVLPGTNTRFPLVMAPYEIINLSDSWVPSPPFLTKTWFDNQLLKKDSFAEINPQTAKQYGLREGDKIVVETPLGKTTLRVTLFEGAFPGYIFVPRGFGHSAYDEFLRGKGANPNWLIGTSKDALSGLPAWWTTPARIKKT
ncbi:MAG: hypothetical protein DRH12_05645 [Deltaproteobacteria bacterium]|nr:MAG: hypothetical protein DRH12_05645 [Deltaproteobacteria bacterium]